MEYLQAQESTAKYINPSISTKHAMRLVKVLDKYDVWEEKRPSAVVLLAAAAAIVEVGTKLEADVEASVAENENDMACKWRRL